MNLVSRITAVKQAWSRRFIPNRRHRRRLLIFADKPGWAFDELAQQRSRYLSESWDVDILYLSDKPKVNPLEYDLMFNPNWGYSEFEKEFHGKYIRGINSHKWERSSMPYRTLRWCLHGAIACFVPNQVQLAKIRRSFPPTFHVTEGIDTDVFHWLHDRFDRDLIVGWSGNPKNQMKRLDSVIRPACEKAGVQLRVAQCPTREDLNIFYNEIDLVLIGSEPLYEGNPLSLFESGACGRAVLATKVGCVPEIVQDGVNGFVVASTFDNEQTIGAFVDRLRWCKEHVEEVRAMGKKHMQRVLAERTLENTCETFRQALEWAYAHRML